MVIMKIKIDQLSKFLRIDYQTELELWIKKIEIGLQIILLDLDGKIIRQDTCSSFGILIYIQSVRYGKCYLKFVPAMLERYDNEKKIYYTLHKSIMCELVKCYDEYNCLALLNCGNEIPEWSKAKEDVKLFFKKVYDHKICSSRNCLFHSYEELLMSKLDKLDCVQPRVAQSVRKAIEIYNDKFTNNKQYIIHGDMHRHNLLVLNNIIKAIDPIGYIAPFEIEYARYIGTELKMIIDTSIEKDILSIWQDMLDYFSEFSPLISEALYVDVVFRMHNATFENDDDMLVNRWFKVLSYIEI